MRKALCAAVTGLALAAVAVPATATAAAAAPPAASSDRGRVHDLRSPLSDKQRALRQEARQQQLQGRISKGAKVGQVAKGQYVELSRTGEDSIFTVLGQFSDLPHGQIPAPDRATDNTTIWSPDFSRSHYQDLLFSQQPGASSMRNYYLEQSSGRYTVNGDVTDWVTVPGTGASYGSNDQPDSAVWPFLQDTLTAWYQQQLAAGRSTADVVRYLSQFDRWDRYDHDGDGNFDEPDGYIDHFQAIHSGMGEEVGGGALGDDAIWSHRWYAYSGNIDKAGPTGNELGGIPIGDTGIWIGDYTVEPENGGVGVFSHEFGHDLGLPDEYDTSGNSGGAENSTAFWTLMSSGSYGNNGTAAEGIGDRPFHMNAWDKLQLGWLDYSYLPLGSKATSLRLGPAEATTKQSQAAIVRLPDKQVVKDIGPAAEGAAYYYSGAANDLDTTMTRTVTVPASGELAAQVRYNIEEGYDYAYLAVDGVKVPTSLSSSAVSPEGVDGVSQGWRTLTADLSAYAGRTVQLAFGYRTDGGVQGQDKTSAPGFAVDAITLGGSSIGTAEADQGWTYATNVAGTAFHPTSGTETSSNRNYYVAENRQYVGFDAGLRSGPYSFGGTVGPDWAERFPYQDGLLVWYWDTTYSDNNVGDHPGRGLILPVDAHPAALRWSDGTVMRPRIQAFDSTFGLEPTDALTLHKAGVATTVPSQKAVPTFDDTASWYTPTVGVPGKYQPGWIGVATPRTGTRISVVSATPGGFMQISVTPPK